jgi:hypothetical protein
MSRGIEAALWGNATKDSDVRQSKATFELRQAPWIQKCRSEARPIVSGEIRSASCPSSGSSVR